MCIVQCLDRRGTLFRVSLGQGEGRSKKFVLQHIICHSTNCCSTNLSICEMTKFMFYLSKNHTQCESHILVPKENNALRPSLH